MKPWKLLLGLFFVLVVFDGALRKWVAPGLSTALLLLKDVVLVGSILSYTFARPLRLPFQLRNTWLPVLLFAYGFWIAAGALNLNVPNFAITALGLKSYLLYLSLLVLVPAALDEMQHPGRVAIVGVCFLILPVLLLGIYQFFHSTTHWINRYVSRSANVVGVGGRPRITGTFSYISGMSTFVLFSLSASLGILVSGLSRKDAQLTILGTALLLLSVVVAPMTGSRSVVVIPAAALPVVLFLVFRKQQMRGSLAMAVVFIAIGTAGLTQWGGLSGGWEGVMHRFEGNETETRGRIAGVFTGPLEKMDVAGFWGYGAGTSMPASTRLASNPEEWAPPVYFEGEMERVVLEVGILGLLLYLFLKLWITILAYRVLRRARGPFEIGVCATAFFFLFMQSAAGSIVADPVTGATYWGLAGVTAAIWGQQEVREAARRQFQQCSVRYHPSRL